MSPSAWANTDDSTGRNDSSSEAEQCCGGGSGDVEMACIRSRHGSFSPTRLEDDGGGGGEAQHFKHEQNTTAASVKSTPPVTPPSANRSQSRLRKILGGVYEAAATTLLSSSSTTTTTTATLKTSTTTTTLAATLEAAAAVAAAAASAPSPRPPPSSARQDNRTTLFLPVSTPPHSNNTSKNPSCCCTLAVLPHRRHHRRRRRRGSRDASWWWCASPSGSSSGSYSGRDSNGGCGGIGKRVMLSCRRALLMFALVVGAGLCVFNVGWKAYWLRGCREGCYERAATATGSAGPEQVHMAYSGVDAEGNPSGMTVVWTTAAGEAPPAVQYGLSPDNLNFTAVGTSVSYLETVHHRTSLQDLAADTRFFYRCGHPVPPAIDDAKEASSGVATVDVVDSLGGLAGGAGLGYGLWSGVSSFVTAPDRARYAGDGPWGRPVSVAVVGDMGLVNAGATFDRLRQLVDDEEVDFVLHLGDIAYADDAFLERPWSFGYEKKWDTFMRKASDDFGSKVPYMVVPGNHEAECHSPACVFSPRKLKALSAFSAYNARFRMPSVESGADHGKAMWYSFNVGPVHFVVIDTETDFPGANGDHHTWSPGGGNNGGFGDQLTWLEEDLAKADGERDVRPWIVVSGHRPMYSKENLKKKVKKISESERVRRVFEPLLKKYNADVYLSGHVHTFERSMPVFDNVVYFDNDNNNHGGSGGGNDHGGNGNDHGDDEGDEADTARPPPHVVSARMVYEEPGAPVHIVNGAGGNIEGMTTPKKVLFQSDYPSWHALSMRTVAGVGILSFPSVAEMKSKFVTSISPAETLDELTIRHHRR